MKAEKQPIKSRYLFNIFKTSTLHNFKKILPDNNDFLLKKLINVSMNTSVYQAVAIKKLREQGLLQLKTKEFTNVNDCF